MFQLDQRTTTYCYWYLSCKYHFVMFWNIHEIHPSIYYSVDVYISYYFKIFQKIYLYFSNRYICSCTTYFFPIFIEHYSHCTDRHGKASRFKSSDINKMLLRISDGLGSSPEIGCKTWTNFSSFLCQFFSMFLRILQVLSKITVWHSSLVLNMQSRAGLSQVESSWVELSRYRVPDPSL